MLLLAAMIAIVAGAVMLVTSRASIAADPVALARVDLPLGGGQIQSVSVVTAPGSRPIPVELRGQQIWPTRLVAAGRAVSLDVVVKRPGWIGWLSGGTERLHLTMTTPAAHALTQYATLSAQAPLRVRFDQPVSVIADGQPGQLARHTLPSAQTVVTLPHGSPAGSVWIAGAPRTWETSAATLVSWFPVGTAAAVVASPTPGTRITASTPITLTFSKPVAQALGSSMPPVLPITQGVWHPLNSHTIVFRPEGYGYGLGTKVSVGLPHGVGIVGGQQGAGSSTATWTVPPGSTARLQQLLAQLGYLPLQFASRGSGVALTPAAQEEAAVSPPAGAFSWRWGSVPSALRSLWQPGASGVMTRGAVMAFENDRGMTPDGDAGSAVWRALFGAVIAGHASTFGYTFVTVSEGSPETESTWHNGRVAVSGPVNTGIPGAATALGIYPVFEHALSVTMSGTNPDGSSYSDPGVPYVSYFNGGDALHGFIRGSYGSAQSLGCVEMPYSEASQVYPYTPIGTLVNVVS